MVYNSLNLRRALVLTSTACGLFIIASPTLANDAAISLSANAAIVSDYRFRGVSLSNKDTAIQGGFDLTTKTGLYIGTWGSSIESYKGSEVELDLYGGYATSFNELDFDIGILAYTYPGSSSTTYWEAYTSVGGSTGILGWTLGAAYAFDQKSIGGKDNIYIYLDNSLPITETAFSLSSHLAYEDGAFGQNKWDWALGANYDFRQFTVGLSYVDTNLNTGNGKAGIIASLSAAF